MTRPWPDSWVPLAAAAAASMPAGRSARRRCAVVEDETGRLHPGIDLDSHRVPAASICAEHAAIAAMCASGGRRVVRLLVAGPAGRPAPPPCGRCLQVLVEFGRAAQVRWGTVEAEHGHSTTMRLLPNAFVDYRPHPEEDC